MLNSVGEDLFFVHFLLRSQADQEDANVFQKNDRKMFKKHAKSSLLVTLFWAFFLEGVPSHHFSPLGYRKTALEVFFSRLGRF